LAESGELKRRPPRHRKGEPWPSWRLEKEIKAITIIAIVSSKKPAGTIRLPFKMSVLADARLILNASISKQPFPLEIVGSLHETY
jgi:hypothetical protein